MISSKTPQVAGLSWNTPANETGVAPGASTVAYADRGVVFLGIVYQDRPEQAVAFFDELGRGYDTDARSRAVGSPGGG